MKRTMIALLAVLCCLRGSAQQDSLLVMFWNLENFFDCSDGGAGASDTDFTPAGSRHWTGKRFNAKCTAVSKIILKAADIYGRIPDVVGFAEVENGSVVRALVKSTALAKLDYHIVHYDSPDHRGIDCALIYRESTAGLRFSSALHLYDSLGIPLPTRDILLARSDSLAVLVNHHPSKVGGSSGNSRKVAMERMESVCDSLENEGIARIISIGDFNDALWFAEGCDASEPKAFSGRKGTIKYNGEWEKIDGCFVRGFAKSEEHILDDPSLMEKDAAFGGLKPRRTYSGPRYLGGVSDHLPIAVMLYF